MKFEQAVFQMEDVRAEQEEDKKVIHGYAAVFEKLSVPMWGFKEKIQRGAFNKSLQKRTTKALWNHNRDLVLGAMKNKTLILEEDQKGLRFEIILPDTQAGRDAYTLIKRGDVDQMSFGFNIIGQVWDESDPKNIVRTLTEVDLGEISIAPFPAYTQTSVKTRSIQEEYTNYKHSNEDTTGESEKRKNEIDLKIKMLELEL